MVEMSELDVADDQALRGFYEVERLAHRADSPYVVLRTWPQLLQMTRRPSPYYHRTLFAAYDDGQMVGCADLGLTQQDNLHLADLEVKVLPEHRRRGTGRALHDLAASTARQHGRTSLHAEVATLGEGEPTGTAYGFAVALGYAVRHEETHQVLDLPVPDDVLATLPSSADGYEIISWRDRAPDDLVDAYSVMRTQLAQDVPSGELDHEPVVIDVARIRESEKRTREAYEHVVAVARRTRDGVLGGYSLVFLPRDSDYVVQDDTLVMPEHRGRRLGLALKGAVLRTLHEQFPERTIVHTWNGHENFPMLRTNQVIGFRLVERVFQMQRTG